MLHVAMKAFYPAEPRFRCCMSTRPGNSGDDRVSRRNGAPARARTDRPHQPRTASRAGSPVRLGLAGPHPGHEDRGSEAGSRPRRLRRRVRRRAARRGKEPRQGAHLLAPLRRPRLGSRATSARNFGAFSTPRIRDGRVDAGLPAVELDRTRRLGIRPGRDHSRRAAVFRPSAPGGRALRHADHGRRRPVAARARRDAGDARGPLPHARLLSADRRDRDRDAETLDGHRRRDARLDAPPSARAA